MPMEWSFQMILEIQSSFYSKSNAQCLESEIKTLKFKSRVILLSRVSLKAKNMWGLVIFDIIFLLRISTNIITMDLGVSVSTFFGTSWC